MPLAASPAVLLGNTPLTPVSAPASVYMHKHNVQFPVMLLCTHWCDVKTFKILSFHHRCRHNRTQLTMLFLVFGMHGSHMATKWVGGRILFLYLYISLSLHVSERAKWDYCNPAWPERGGNPNAVYSIPLVSLPRFLSSPPFLPFSLYVLFPLSSLFPSLY